MPRLRLTDPKTLLRAAIAMLIMALPYPAQAATGKGTTGWSSSAEGTSGSAIYAWSSGCTKDCNDEVDFEPLITIDCNAGEAVASLVFWSIGAERDDGRQVGVRVRIDGYQTRLQATGASKLNGVSLDLKLPLSHPLFQHMASGKAMSYGSDAGGQPNTASLQGSGKAIRRMLSACR